MHDDEHLADTWMRNFAASVAATEAQLTALDQQVGDGDFGVNLLAGTGATLRALEARDGAPAGPRSAARPLRTAADVFLDEVGGTSGPLFGLLLQEIAVAVAETGPVLDTSTLALGVGSGLAAIQRVGRGGGRRQDPGRRPGTGGYGAEGVQSGDRAAGRAARRGGRRVGGRRGHRPAAGPPRPGQLRRRARRGRPRPGRGRRRPALLRRGRGGDQPDALSARAARHPRLSSLGA